MNVAMIMAGGCGNRAHNTIPKQFVSINGKPVIIHTLLAFQNHPAIDEICIVCLDGWHETLLQMSNQYKITKLQHITTGGDTAHDSIFHGLNMMREYYSPNTLVIQHDAVRPLVSQKQISDCIATTQKYGNAIATIPCPEALVYSTDNTTSDTSVARETIKRTQTPNGYRLGHMWNLHKRAQSQNKTQYVATCNLLIDMGETVHLFDGAESNIKITTAEDFNLVTAIMNIQNKKQK